VKFTEEKMGLQRIYRAHLHNLDVIPGNFI